MLNGLKEKVFLANLELPKHGLVIFTWGNVSGIDRDNGLVVIKPSGIPYTSLSPDQMVVVDLDGNILSGDLKPSSDLNTHLALYKAFDSIGGIVHTHSTFATSIAQSGKKLPSLGTTHADYFYGDIPITRDMTDDEINGDYEFETGKVIIEAFKDKNPNEVPGVFVKSHGPFTWGIDAFDAVHNAVVLEEISKMAVYSYSLNPFLSSMNETLLNKHFLRKHGKDAYYGQK